MSLRVMITGAGRGIGLALTTAYLARGDEVLATVRAGARASLDALSCPRLSVLEMDVNNTESVRAARSVCKYDFIDILIQNAGRSGGPQHAPGMDLARAEEIISVNSLGPLRVYDAFVDLLRQRKSARKLIHVSSEAGSLGHFRASAKPEYAMSKAALNALTRWVAAKDLEIVTVSIDPGWTQTDTGGSGAPQTPDMAARVLVAAIDRVGEEHRGRFVDNELRDLVW